MFNFFLEHYFQRRRINNYEWVLTRIYKRILNTSSNNGERNKIYKNRNWILVVNQYIYTKYCTIQHKRVSGLAAKNMRYYALFFNKMVNPTQSYITWIELFYTRVYLKCFFLSWVFLYLLIMMDTFTLFFCRHKSSS